MTRKLEELFGIDLRSLAVFRVGLGLLVLADLAGRSSDLIAFYTDDGVLPRSLLLQQYLSPWRMSIHLMNGTALFQSILFIIAAVSALALVLGWRTKAATFLSWFFLMSLHVRNPMVLHSGDYLLRLLLFWSTFLPFEETDENKSILSAGSVALLGQGVLVYAFASMAKWNDPAWMQGRAVYQALSTSQYTTPLGLVLLNAPAWLLKFLSYSVLWFETLGPILLLSPIFTGPVRCASVIGFFCMQLGFGTFLNLGLFPWISSVAMIPFLPSWFWEKVHARVGLSKGNSFSATAGLRSSRFANLVLCFLMTYILCANLSSGYFMMRMLAKLSWIGEMLYLDQTWSMFTPPDESSIWYVVVGELKDGRTVDLFRKGQAVSWDQPHPASVLFKNVGWYKYLNHLWSPNFSAHLPYYAWYLCRDWNGQHAGSEQVRRLNIYGMYQRFYPKAGPPQAVHFWTHSCLSEA